MHRGPNRLCFTVSIAALCALVVACGPSQRRAELTGEQGAVGTYAREFLTDSTYASLVVSVDYVANEIPSAPALSMLQQRLEKLCHKPAGIVVRVGDEVPGNATHVYSDADVVAIAGAHRTLQSQGEQLVAHGLYLDGRSARSDPNGAYTTLGLAVQATTFCVFRQSISLQSSAMSESQVNVEGAVLLHEMGHLMGLVDLGTALTSAHEDLAHPSHCNNQACVMNWLITATSSGGLNGLSTVDFDDACRADLVANGGL